MADLMNHPGARKGAVLLLVVLSVAVSLVAGLTFLAASSTTSGIAAIVDEHAQSRQIAESGIALGIAYMEREPAWREQQSEGVWVAGEGLLEGTLTLSAEFGADPAPSISLTDASFEEEVGALPQPLLNPPMTGVIGGWSVTRTALLATGATVPSIGTRASTTATEGANEAFISFGLSVTGSGALSQSLGVELAPHLIYEIVVDVTPSGAPPLDSSHGVRLFAGGTLLVSTEEALTLFETLTAEEIERQAEQLLVEAQEPATLVANLLSGPAFEYRLRFTTAQDPPPGELRLELFAESLGVVTAVAFDNVRLEVTGNAPIRLHATGRRGRASHAVGATVARGLAGGLRIVEWTER